MHRSATLKSLLLCASLSLLNTATAQTLSRATPLATPAVVGEPCGFEALHQQLLQSDARYRDRTQAFDALARSNGGLFSRSLSTYKIPVVVHVMGTGNSLTAITDDQVRGAIRNINERFRKVAGTPGFGNGVDVGIEFVLAVRDPNGNCTTGITRTNMTGNATYMASGVFLNTIGITDASLKALDVWDQTQYYNIWAVSEIDGNDGGSGIAGYALFSGAHGTAADGTVITVAQLRDPASTATAHELGHSLSVYHTFEDDNNGASCPPNANCATQGDLVCDTPPHIRSASNCNSAGTNACDGNSSNSLFVANYMDYSSSACHSMFSSGQAARMVLALTTDRASFLAANGNVALVPPGAPTMDILASASLLCGTGQSVTLQDNTRCVPNTWLPDSEFPGISFSWNLSNGVNTYTSTAQNPTFTLASAGTYNATLTTTTLLGTTTRTENGIVVVTAAPVAACTPTSQNPSANYGFTVSQVRFNTFDNTTSAGVNGVYQNFSCTKNTVVARNGAYPLAVTINGLVSNGPQVYEAYIDYNNNGTFENPGELISSGSTTGTTTVNATITIPNTAVQNALLRMRVYGDAGSISATERSCGAALLVADVEDYGVYVSSTLAAVSIAASPSTTITYGTTVTFTPTPTNGGAGPVYHWYRNGTFMATGATWSSATLLPGDQVYALLFSNLAGVVSSPATSNTLTMAVTGTPLTDFVGAPRQICTGGTVAFTDLSLLSPTSWSWSFPGGTPGSSTAQNPTVTYSTPGTYAVTLTASNALGAGITNTKTAYITVLAPPPSGCAVSRSTAPTAGIGIVNVSLNTINNSTAFNDAAMVDLVCSQITTLAPGTLYPISVAVGSFNTQWVRVYIDYNRNGVFTDAGELIFSPPNGVDVRSGTFTTPAAPTPGVLMRMRVITDFVNTTPGACTSPVQYGQVEEYGIVFTAPANVQVAVKAMLEGPYASATGTMTDALRSLPGFPLAQPYSGAPWNHAGAETVAPSVMAVTGNNAVVDWVLVELRSSADNTVIVTRAAALIQRDGDVVATDGVSPVTLGTPPGSYFVALHHRNHLPVMTASALTLSSTASTVDFTLLGTTTYSTEARKSITGAFPTQALWAGDVTANRQIKYTGGSNDRDPILTAIGGTTPTNTVSGYLPSDVTMDGNVKYTGSANDRDVILLNIGGSAPTNIRNGQLP